MIEVCDKTYKDIWQTYIGTRRLLSASIATYSCLPAAQLVYWWKLCAMPTHGFVYIFLTKVPPI